jgi:photosystem II stability/assembly factor-like uncharacterized protein
VIIAAVSLLVWVLPGDDPVSEDVRIVDQDGSHGMSTKPPYTSNGTWQQVNVPRMGTLMMLTLVMDTADASVLYMGTQDGLYITKDGGQTWAQQWAGEQISSVAVDPGQPGVVYVAAPDLVDRWRLQRSSDAGETWSMVSKPGMDFQSAILVDSTVSPSVLYTTGEYETTSESMTSWQSGLLRSTDGGVSWKVVVLPDQADLMASCGETLFAISQYSDNPTLFLSTNAGADWQKVKTPDTAQNLAPSHLRTDPRDPSRVFLYAYVVPAAELASDAELPAPVVFASSDTGTTWTELKGDELAWACTLDLVAPGTAATTITSASAYLKSLSGSKTAPASATEYGTGLSMGYYAITYSMWTGIVVDPGDPHTLYAYDPAQNFPTAALYKSTDQGTTWKSITDTITTPSSLSDFAIDPVSPATLYASTDTALLKSDDDGATWTTVHKDQALALAVAPSAPDTLYACYSDGFYRSTDGGATWSPCEDFGLPLGEDYASMLSYSQEETSLPLVVSAQDANLLLADLPAGVYRSTDAGDSWTMVRGLPPMNAVPTEDDPYPSRNTYGELPIVQDPDTPSTFYTVKTFQTGSRDICLYTSTDSGLTWHRVATLAKANSDGYFPLTMDPGHPLTLYAEKVHYEAGDDSTGFSYDTPELSRSIDGGTTWDPVSVDGLDDNVVAPSGALYADPWTPGTLYLVTETYAPGSGKAVYHSADSGDTWERLSDLPKAVEDAWYLHVVTAPDGSLYVKTDSSVFRWTP